MKHFCAGCLPSFSRCTARQRRARTPVNASLKRSPAATALRCSILRPAAELASRLCATLKQPQQASQRARFARGRKPCAARRFRGALPGLRARLCTEIVGAPAGEHQQPGFAAGGSRRGRSLWRRGAQAQGRRALARFVSSSPRLSERSAQHEVSSAARPCDEHRSAVCATRRPPQCEPPPATACREAAREKHPLEQTT
jgi:hypothetical protein